MQITQNNTPSAPIRVRILRASCTHRVYFTFCFVRGLIDLKLVLPFAINPNYFPQLSVLELLNRAVEDIRNLDAG